jgi:TonB family protein
MEFPRALRRAALLLTLALISTFSWTQQSAERDRKVVVKTPAVYPTLARSMNIKGTVRLEAQVLPNGNVKRVEVLGGHPILTQSAVTAVEHWKYEPASHETKEPIVIEFDPQ